MSPATPSTVTLSSPPSVHVGIDVSKATLDVCLLPGGQTLSVGNDDDGIAQVVALLREQPVTLVLLEATGRYERRVASELLEAGFNVAVVNPGPADVSAGPAAGTRLRPRLGEARQDRHDRRAHARRVRAARSRPFVRETAGKPPASG